jgi:hypothetical protein
MRRARLGGITAAALLLLGASATTAVAEVPSEIVVAVEAPAEGEPLPGPDPRMDGGEFGPRQYDVPWTYGMGVALAGVAVIAIIGTMLGYWFLVVRPERESAES